MPTNMIQLKTSLSGECSLPGNYNYRVYASSNKVKLHLFIYILRITLKRFISWESKRQFQYRFPTRVAIGGKATTLVFVLDRLLVAIAGLHARGISDQLLDTFLT